MAGQADKFNAVAAHAPEGSTATLIATECGGCQKVHRVAPPGSLVATA
jgi:hypothetical protein